MFHRKRPVTAEQAEQWKAARDKMSRDARLAVIARAERETIEPRDEKNKSRRILRGILHGVPDRELENKQLKIIDNLVSLRGDLSKEEMVAYMESYVPKADRFRRENWGYLIEVADRSYEKEQQIAKQLSEGWLETLDKKEKDQEEIEKFLKERDKKKKKQPQG